MYIKFSIESELTKIELNGQRFLHNVIIPVAVSQME